MGILLSALFLFVVSCGVGLTPAQLSLIPKVEDMPAISEGVAAYSVPAVAEGTTVPATDLTLLRANLFVISPILDILVETAYLSAAPADRSVEVSVGSDFLIENQTFAVKDGNGTLKVNKLSFDIDGGLSIDQFLNLTEIDVKNINTKVSIKVEMDITYDTYSSKKQEEFVFDKIGYDYEDPGEFISYKRMENIVAQSGYVKAALETTIDLSKGNLNVKKLMAIVGENYSTTGSFDTKAFMTDLFTDAVNGSVMFNWSGELAWGATVEWDLVDYYYDKVNSDNDTVKLLGTYGAKIQNATKLKYGGLFIPINIGDAILADVDSLVSTGDETDPKVIFEKTVDMISNDVIGKYFYGSSRVKWLTMDFNAYKNDGSAIQETHFVNGDILKYLYSM